MNISFNTTTNTPSRNADAGVNASAGSGAPDSGAPANVLFALPAQGTLAADGTTLPALAVDLPPVADTAADSDVPADIAKAATAQEV
ncbi:MAG: hypothetical protein RSH52_29150, partial [Janthinobacterium sp.]